jgi:hypothetical protein
MPRTIRDKPERSGQPQRIPERLQLSDESASPGLELMERIGHSRKPSAEDLAILEAWRFRVPLAPNKIKNSK